ncbi:hypothetical protein M1563_02185 [Patescibacteria group bacterium]|nr:hypothetical protein [Patescibacteria group bacterium]
MERIQQAINSIHIPRIGRRTLIISAATTLGLGGYTLSEILQLNKEVQRYQDAGTKLLNSPQTQKHTYDVGPDGANVRYSPFATPDNPQTRQPILKLTPGNRVSGCAVFPWKTDNPTTDSGSPGSDKNWIVCPMSYEYDRVNRTWKVTSVGFMYPDNLKLYNETTIK